MQAALLTLVSVLSFPSFGVDKNPKAPSPAEVLRYAPDAADFLIYVDAEAFVEKNYKAFGELAKTPELKGTDAARAIELAFNNAEMARGIAKGAAGFDFVTDLKSLAIWIRIHDAGEPDVLAVVRGNFPSDLLSKLGTMPGMGSSVVDGQTVVAVEPGKAMAMAPDGALLAGNESWVLARAAKGWKPIAAKNGISTTRATQVLQEKPFLAFFSAPGSAAVRILTADAGRSDNALVDLVSGHEFMAVALRHDGVSWTVVAKSADGYQRAVRASEGMLSLFRAGQHATRGLVNLAAAALESYRGSGHPALDALIASQDKWLALVDDWTGSGNFRATVNKLGAAKTVTVKATDKELSDVIPMQGIAVLVAAGAYWSIRSVPYEAGGMARALDAEQAPAAVPAGAASLDIKDSYRRAKARVFAQ